MRQQARGGLAFQPGFEVGLAGAIQKSIGGNPCEASSFLCNSSGFTYEAHSPKENPVNAGFVWFSRSITHASES
jgi:hypothetical protein